MRFIDEDDVGKALIAVCRNGRCAVGRGGVFAPGKGTPSELGIGLSLDDTRAPLELTLVVDVENAALADGDRYAVTIEHRDGTVTSFERTAVYETSFPNGSCDPHPCRHIRFEVQ
jgi:hypothetical protein